MKKILLALLLVSSIANITYAKTYKIGIDTKSLEINKGDKVILKLEENPTTGYVWKFTSGPDNVIGEEKEKFVQNKSKLAGAPGVLYYEVKAIGQGKATIQGKHARFWEKTKPIQTYKLDIVVK